MSERVDKSWQTKGIDCYSTEAIFGTLAHYGVAMDEAGFRELAKADFPLGIAHAWHQRWTGKGQFSHFPASAAEELWKRFLAPAIAPTDLALALINLLQTTERIVEGVADDGTWNTRFAVVEAYLPKVPEATERREKFMGELVAAMGEWMERFDDSAQALAKKGQLSFADRLVAIEETLLPVRAGTASALVTAAKGDLPAALNSLQTIAHDQAREPLTRLSAIDGLLGLDQTEVPKRALLELLELAEKNHDLELASHVVELLTELLREHPQLPDRQAIRARVESLAASLGPGPEDQAD